MNKTQKQFQNIFEYSSVPVFLMDAKSKITSCNVALEKMLGYSLDEITNLSFKDIIHPDDWIASEIFFPSVINAGSEGFYMESRLKHNDGHYLWMETFISAVIDDSERLINVILMVQDITEKKMAQDALIESERKLQEAQQIAGLGRWEWDIIGDKSKWSDIVYDILGRDKSHKNVSQDIFNSLIPQNEKENLLSSKEWKFQTNISRPNEEEKYIAIQGRVEKDTNGIPVRAVGTFQDITELHITRLEIEQKSHDLTLINDVNSIINEPGKLENVYARISHWFFEQFSCTGFILSYPVEEKNILKIDYFNFVSPIAEIFKENQTKDIPSIELSFRDNGVHSNILTKHKPQFINIDIFEESITNDIVKSSGNWINEELIQSIQNEDLTSLIAHQSIFPLIADDKVWALIHIFRNVSLTKNDINRISTICQQTASIIRRKRAVDGLILHRERLLLLSRKLFYVQEEERRRLALELHDDLGQSLTAMKINISKALSKLNVDIDKSILEKLTDTIQMIDTSEESIRDISLMLRPSMLDELGLLSSLEWYVGHYAKRNEIMVNLDYLLTDEYLLSDQQIVLYRITQEALTNIARHANAKNVDIIIRRKDGNILSTIKDDGDGFDYEAVTETESLKKSAGLFGMKERVRLVNGEIYIKTKPGDGTEIQITIPIEE
ncbi:MAG: PAS domain S-box protein [Candidatus Marinimicrobia bacterium]|nr:PAS domain S-box protein [Candidatus Neomarinimicrobiota bacterium]